MKKKTKLCIGIDQSYQDTGITVNQDNGKIIHCFSVKAKSKETKTKYRERIYEFIKMLLWHWYGGKNIQLIIVVERIRQFSGPRISMNYIKAISALIAVIVDAAANYGIKVYSVDTRCWKANIIGTSKPKKNKKGIDPKKYPTYEWCKKNKYNKFIMLENKKGIKKYNDNVGDSIAISFSPWNKKIREKLQLET